jgi:hypothetical protein
MNTTHRGMVRYGVDPATGNVGNPLTDNTWDDAAGNVIKSQPAGAKDRQRNNCPISPLPRWERGRVRGRKMRQLFLCRS